MTLPNFLSLLLPRWVTIPLSGPYERPAFPVKLRGDLKAWRESNPHRKGRNLIFCPLNYKPSCT